VRSYYHTGNRQKARKLVQYLKKVYPSEWLVSEKYIPQILMRLKFPDALLGLFINLKRGYKNMFAGK
jgi:hypothetical protein